MMPALHQHLIATQRDGFLDLRINLRQRDHIRVVILLGAIERAELAIDVADVRVVDVAIHVVGDDPITTPGVSLGLGKLPAMIRESAEFFEREGIESSGIGSVDAFAVPNFLEQLVQ